MTNQAHKKFAFVSDFDGTLSTRDFYHIMIDKYLSDWGPAFYREWKKTQKINVTFLNRIFGSLQLTRDQLTEEILQIPLDSAAPEFIQSIQNLGGHFYILSAGTSYYIHILLDHLKLQNIEIISMEGRYENGGIKIYPDPGSPFFSDIFGVDKKKFILSLKEAYDYVCFAGDSEPDLTAAIASDFAFAKAELSELLSRNSDVATSQYASVKGYQDINKIFFESIVPKWNLDRE